MGFKIFIGCFLSPFVAVGIGLILLILGVFPEFGQPPIAFLIPFAIIWNGIIGLMIYLIFIKKMNFQGQIVRLQKRVESSQSSVSPSSGAGQWSLSSKGNLDSFPEQPASTYSSGYSSDSREEAYASSPPPTIPKSNLRIGRFLALVMPLGIIVYLVVFQIYPMIEEAGGLEQAYATNGTFLLLMAGAVLALFVGMLRSLRAMQRMSENTSSF